VRRNPRRRRGVGPGRKVLRGGSWNNNWNNARAANRNNNNPTNRNNNIGFRCAGSPGAFLKGQVRRV
jgi:formylglycine-generating enzyme required for sulfatase activity